VKATQLLLALCLAGCPKEPAPPPAAHEEAALPSELTVTEAAQARASIATAPVRRGQLGARLTLTGELAAQPDRTAHVSSTTPGRLEQVSFNEGQVVKRGDVLATVRVPDVGRLRGAFAAANARARASRANAERLAALKSSGLGAEQPLVDAEADARAQEAEAKALGEQLSAIGINAESGAGFLVALRAPLGGVVVKRDAVVGQPISPEHVLATIVDVSELWFLGRVFEKDLARLVVGAKAELELNAFEGERFEGQLAAVSQQLDVQARTLIARVRVPNPGGRLRLGLFGRAYLEGAGADGGAGALLVRRDALVEADGKTLVFVKTAPDRFVPHEVQVGRGAQGEVELTSGMDEGAEVVVRGTFTLKSLLLKSTLAEEE
jgi:cobalt-zinc-cadmium efflux system membrane fusion protein